MIPQQTVNIPGTEKRYLSHMSGSLARTACTSSTHLCDAEVPRIVLNRMDWDRARDMFVRKMPIVEKHGDGIAERIFSVITHERYMHGGDSTKKAVRKYRPVALERICRSVRCAEPIEIVLPSFPLKCTHPLKMHGNRADMAEISAFAKFHELCKQIEGIYPPGVVITIIQDGMLHFEGFGRRLEEAWAYALDLRRFVGLMGLQNEIKFLDLRTEFERQSDHCIALTRAIAEIEDEVGRPENEKHFSGVVASSFASLSTDRLPPQIVRRIFMLDEELLSPEEQLIKRILESRAITAAIQFLAYGRAIEHLDLYERIRPNALRGSVHSGPGRLPIRFHANGTKILPWMGVAVKEDTGMTVKYVCDVEHNRMYVPVYLRGGQHPFYFRHEGIQFTP